jgi:hypothetical protein
MIVLLMVFLRDFTHENNPEVMLEKWVEMFKKILELFHKLQNSPIHIFLLQSEPRQLPLLLEQDLVFFSP